MSGCKTKHDEGVESGNGTGIALIIFNDSQVYWVWRGFVIRRTYRTAEDMSYFRLAFSSMFVSLVQTQCWCEFWKFGKFYLALFTLFSCDVTGHCTWLNSKEIALVWLLVKALLFAVETWAYFSTTSFYRCALMNNTFLLLKIVQLL